MEADSILQSLVTTVPDVSLAPPMGPVEVDPENTVDQEKAESQQCGQGRKLFVRVQSLPNQLEEYVRGQEDCCTDQKHAIEDIALAQAEMDLGVCLDWLNGQENGWQGGRSPYFRCQDRHTCVIQ